MNKESKRFETGANLYVLESWSVSGVHTGWRVLKYPAGGDIYDTEVLGAWVSDMYKPGSDDIAYATALKFFEELTVLISNEI